MPRAMKPAPTIPTRTGFPVFARFSSSLSTINTETSLQFPINQILPLHRSFSLGRGLLPTPYGRGQPSSCRRALTLKIGPAPVFIRNHRGLDRPLDAQTGIVPTHAALGLGGIELRGQIGHF